MREVYGLNKSHSE